MNTRTAPSLRRLGNSGLAVSATGLGCNNLGRKGTVTATLPGCALLISAAVDAGITLFDTADIYGAQPGLSEELLGKALGKRRGDVVVATKFGMDAQGLNGPDFGARGSRRYIRTAVEGSLSRLGTDWIDLYQQHEPDPATPIAETISALTELVREGKIRYFGHSNFSGWQLADADWTARSGGYEGFISAQNDYSLLNRRIEVDLLPAARAFGVGVLPFYPLANGLLTGKYTRDHRPADSRITDLKPHLFDTAPFDQLEALASLARERDITMVELVFGWLLAQPSVSSVIAGATTPAQIQANAAAADAWVPTTADLVAIDHIFPPAA
ncbi:aldo/keto reductase [Nakamurella antarctica]|uniref:Aldo/keto reductase n=1 Tax=Nakamurella antarctica TaxID=1902245 RepID=A0A3G8ZI90_9ACTN|nr:aldo/keto reductase [Nakamurella antarctica]AZI57033.1 aldo/keto reductase [Nakamurella antarctica]